MFRPLLRKVPPIRLSTHPGKVFLLVGLITLVAFAVRLWYPIGSDVANLQFSFFSGYIFMFAAGILAYNDNFFDRITYRDGKRWLALSLGIGIPFWMLIIFFGGPADGIMEIEGGMNWPAFFYALWESYTCVTFSIALVKME